MQALQSIDVWIQETACEKQFTVLPNIAYLC